MANPMDPRNRIAYDVGFYTLALVFLLLRFAQRLTPGSLRRIRQNPSVPAFVADFFMLLTLAFTTTAIGLDLWLQRRTIYLSSDLKFFGQLLALYPIGMKIMFANQMFWALLMWSVKAALMALYYDISKHVTERVKRLMHATCFVLVLTFFAVIATPLAWCRPISTNWTLGPEMCSPQAHVFPIAFTSTLHIITDMMVLGIPLLILRTLNLQRAQVLAVYFVFGIGFLAFSVALVSLALQIEVVGINHNSPTYLQEIEIKTERVYLAAIAECSIAIVGACLPSLRVFLRMLLKSAREGSGKKNSSGHGSARKEKGSKGGSAGAGSTAPLMMRPSGGFAGGNSGFGPSRSGSPALKKPLLAISSPALTRGSPPKDAVAGDEAGVAEYAIRRSRSRSPSVDSLIINIPADQAHQLQALGPRNPSEVSGRKSLNEDEESNIGMGITTDDSVDQYHHSDIDQHPPPKPPAFIHGHQRTWSGAGAPVPSPIPLSYSPDHWR